MSNSNDFKILIDSIPKYDGNPKTLTQYVLNIEQINNLINSLIPVVSNVQKQIVFLAIKSKIVGKANEELRNYQFETWEQLKNHLLSNFADHQSAESLIIEIMHINSGNKSPMKTLTEIKEKFDLFRAKINLVEENQTCRDSIIKFQELVITNNFICSLKDPMRNNLATRGPKTLAQVEQLLINDFQYMKSQSVEYPKQNMQRLPNIPPMRFPGIPRPSTRPIQNFPSQPIKFDQNKQQRQMFVPRMQVKNAQGIKPTPMSVQTRQSFTPRSQNYNAFQNRTNYSPNYTFEELNNIEELDTLNCDTDQDFYNQVENEYVEYDESNAQNQEQQNSFLELTEPDSDEKS